MSCSRERDETCFRLCKAQARIFERSSLERMPSHFFVKSFRASPYARKMDELAILDDVVSEEEIFQSIKRKVKTRRGVVYSAAAMSWIGYVLREWSYRFKTYTSLILDKVNLTYLAEVYPAYHSLDILKAIEKIAADQGIDLEETPEERLEAILRKPATQF